MADKTFIRITNKNIYDEIVELKKVNNESHNEIIEHQMTTNGKVKLNRWMATSALAILGILIGYLAEHLITGG